jgi:hypothetical protein
MADVQDRLAATRDWHHCHLCDPAAGVAFARGRERRASLLRVDARGESIADRLLAVATSWPEGIS